MTDRHCYTVAQLARRREPMAEWAAILEDEA